MMTLPTAIEQACEPLFEAHPLDKSMNLLVGSEPKHIEIVQKVLEHPALADRPDLAAGIWLYVDDLDRSHTICQGIETPTGSYWHAIMHRREGDFSNSRYWHRRAASHPLLAGRPEGIVGEVEKLHGSHDPATVTKQREEWLELFVWCANQEKE